MTERTKPKVFCRKELFREKEKIGYLQLVSYLRGSDDIAHLEFSLEEEYHNKGIMSRELPIYLKYLKKWDHKRLLAYVKNTNSPSIKLLEKNNFILVTPYKDLLVYALDFNLLENIRKMRNIPLLS